MIRHILLCCCFLVSALASDEVLHDQWYSGSLAGEQAISAHEQSLRTDTGFMTRFRMTMMLKRAIGPISSTLHFQQDRRYQEDDQGRLTAFQFEDDQNGMRVSVEGTVADGSVQATIARNGTIADQTLTLPKGVVLYGQQGGQRLLAEAELDPGQQLVFHGVELMGSRIVLIATTATLVRALPNDLLELELRADILPVPITVHIDRSGNMQLMRMAIGPLAFELTPCDGPQAISAAELDVVGLFNSSGKTPMPVAENRYRIPVAAREAMPDTGFQRLDGDLVVVTSVAAEQALDDPAPWLAREPQLETDDPAIIAWVGTVLAGHESEPIAERAERLRLAVRSHISKKDLSQSDATAAECFASKTGDCTEHANLLACALRIAGIPSRCEVGLVYAAALGGWGGHAWTSAYDSEQGRWIHLDAAYPGVARSQYICTAIASGGDGQNMVAMLQGLVAIMGGTIETL